jgi:hypothetical protein
MYPQTLNPSEESRDPGSSDKDWPFSVDRLLRFWPRKSALKWGGENMKPPRAAATKLTLLRFCYHCWPFLSQSCRYEAPFAIDSGYMAIVGYTGLRSETHCCWFSRSLPFASVFGTQSKKHHIYFLVPPPLLRFMMNICIFKPESSALMKMKVWR